MNGATFRAMEDAQEKLRCLNYETLFVRKLQQRPVSRHEFVLPAQNAGLQFNHYIQLIKWILSQIISNNLSNSAPMPTQNLTPTPSLSASSEFQNVDVYDDPNVIAQKLMLALRELEYDINFPITKLKQPYGEVATSILNFLADLALEKKGFEFMEPRYITAERNDRVGDYDSGHKDGDDDDDVIVTDDEETFEDSNDSIELCYEITDFENNNNLILSQSEATYGMISTKIDPIEWKMEIERVSPALDIQFDEDGDEQNCNFNWRRQINLALTENEIIFAEIERSNDVFERLSRESNRFLEMIEFKERTINDKFKHITDQYKMLCGKKDKFEEKRKDAMSSLDEINVEMASLSKKLSKMREKVDEKGNMMTDTSPLVQIKTTLKDIKAEIRDYDLQIGILEHNLVQRRLLSKLNQ